MIINLKNLCKDEKQVLKLINKKTRAVFITHAHYDHMDGAINVVNLMKELGHPVP